MNQKITVMNISDLQKLADDVHDNSDLIGYAAHAALNQLLESWRVADCEGADLSKMVRDDVASLIAELNAFRDKALAS